MFGVADIELRRKLMTALDSYRYQMYERFEGRQLFAEGFANKLRAQRCRPPQVSMWGYLQGILTIAVLGVAAFRGPLDAIAVGVALLFPALFLIARYIAELYQHDVAFHEAVRVADLNAAAAKAEAARRLNLPEIFSSREKRTGEPVA